MTFDTVELDGDLAAAAVDELGALRGAGVAGGHLLNAVPLDQHLHAAAGAQGLPVEELEVAQHDRRRRRLLRLRPPRQSQRGERARSAGHEAAPREVRGDTASGRPQLRLTAGA